ncbi:hypothetical protein ACLMJK_003319 [Lecanora helva]
MTAMDWTVINEKLTWKLQNAVANLPQTPPPFPFSNEHFFAPQSVSSIFTGRSKDLEVLKQCLQEASYGKQSLLQKSFWGVFWIDASSQEHAKQSFSTIARVGKIEPNERAAKSWLSSLGPERPWLLIIDNADDANFPVEECYPNGEDGIILITTRNPLLRVHGTIGLRYLEFADMDQKESVELLLRAADVLPPWPATAIASAEEICKTLGYLPLAIVHAGTTILSRLCTLDSYLSFFRKSWSRIRTMKASSDMHTKVDANAAIYSSYELIHEGLLSKGTQASNDALDLLKIFSFLHLQRIRVDFFLRAAYNSELETHEQRRQYQEEARSNNRSMPKATWAGSLKGFAFGAYAYLLKLGDRPALPRLLRDVLDSKSFAEVRLREALKELFQMSLIFPNPNAQEDSYSMHPVVHLWVRERPGMTIADQAIWCQVAANVLTQAILLPPLGDKEEDEILRRDLLPHVSHVQHHEQVIRSKYLANQVSRTRLWPSLRPRFDRNRLLQLVKFSIVYAQCDHLKEAEILQSEVAHILEKTLGVEHTATMNVMLLLSSTYWQLTQGDKAAELQHRVLTVCVDVRGKDNLKTLQIMDAYGSSLWQQGRILEARKNHEVAYKGFRNLLGESDVVTLRAMGNLGRAVGKDFHFSKAIVIHSKVLSGLRKKLEPTHLDTLIAQDNLAMAYYDRVVFGFGHPKDLDRAVELEKDVFEQRREKLGREHLYTLWAGLNLARIKAVRGEITEALSIFLAGHVIAIRNLGETHFAVLFAKLHYGRILMHAHKYADAENILTEVIKSHENARQSHPDRLLALFSLVKCRNLLGKADETADLMEELIERTKNLFGEDHAFFKYLLNPQNLSQEPDYAGTPPSRAASWDINPSRTASWNSTEENTVVPGNLKPAAMIAKYGHV